MEKNIKSFLSQVKSSTLSSGFKLQLLFLIIGAVMVAGSIIYRNASNSNPDSSVEVIGEETNDVVESKDIKTEIAVDVRGEVLKPGVYKLTEDARVGDAINASGGLSENADIVWVDKNINQAAKIIDGQKIYIPKLSENSTNKQSEVLSANITNTEMNVAQSDSQPQSALINVNTASLNQLDQLPGIGQVYGQSIIDHRPYSTLNELVSKKALKQATFEKIKDLITLF